MSVGTNGNLPKRKPPGSRPIVTAATLPPGGGRPLVEHIDTFVARVQAYFSKLYLNPDEAYKQTRDHGASMRRDPVVMEPLRQRQLATALLDFQICPEDEGDVIQKAVCEDLKLCVQRTPYWTKMLMCLQEAIWFGKYAVNMYGYHWDRFNPWRMLPGEWIPVHGDKLKFEHETGRVGIRISSLANLSDRSDFRIDTEGRVVMVPDEWLSAGDRKALIVHKHEIEDGDFFDATTAGSIHGVGLRTRVYWPWFLKQKAVQWLMSWAEQVGLGVKVWYFEQSNPESEAAVRRAAEQNNENMNILMPRSIGTEGQGAGLELLEPSSGGAQFLQDLADKYWGDQIKRMIVGQTLTSQTAPTGMGSEVGKQHRETFDQLVKYDALNLAETISQQMLSVLVDYGYPGITWEPRFEFVLEEQDPRELMEAAKLFIDMGGEASEDEIRDIAGLKKPQKGEKVLGGKAALAAQQPQGFPPGGDEGKGKGPLDLDALAAERSGEPVRFAFNESEHPRGQPENAGQFAEKPSARTHRPIGDLQKHKDAWNVRKNGGLDALFEANKRVDPDGITRSSPFSAELQKVNTDIFDLDPNEGEHAFAMAIKDEFDESPYEFTFENVHTGYGEKQDKFGVTGTGHAKEVIEKASALFVGALERFKPVVTYYTSAEESRTKVYEFLTRRVGRHTAYSGFRLDIPGAPDFFCVVRDDSRERFIALAKEQGIKIWEPQRASRMTWAEFSKPLRFARRKPAAGQQSLSWDESEHPREGDGKFAEKGGGAAKVADDDADDDFSLTNKPDKPARKPAEPHKDTSEQSHLFAGSDWKPGQEELFDPEGDEPEQPKDEPKPKKEKPKQLIVDAAQTWFGEGKRLSKMTNIQMNVMLDSFTKYPDDYGLTHGEAFTIGAALDGVQHAMNTGRLSGQSEQWWRALNVPEKLKVVQKVIAKAGAMKASGDYYESFRDLAIKESEKGI